MTSPLAALVLLAPIGTSFDLFKDYKARGASFARAAQAIAQTHGGGRS